MNLNGRIIGIDESGKGDFFGPLVIAGCLADSSHLDFLARIGVRDSKTIAPAKLLDIDRQLRERLPFHLVVFMPDEYNRVYKKIRNLNILLASGHARAISGLLASEEADLAISDKFGKAHRLEDALAQIGCTLPLEQMVRGEVVPQVAAASIIARAEFVRLMGELSDSVGGKLPKGAGPPVDQAGRQLVREHGVEILGRVAKLHFKNYQRVVNPVLL